MPEALPSIQDYFKAAPAFLTARIRFEGAQRLFRDQIAGLSYIEGSLRPHQDLDVWVSKDELKIDTRGGLRISIAGLPINITQLKYNNRTGVVEANSTILGIDAGDHYVEKRIAEELRKKFRLKLQIAFARLLKIRQQKTLGEAFNMLNAVIDVFKPQPKPGGGKPRSPLPTFTGEVTLLTEVPRTQSVRIGPTVGELKEGDVLSSSVIIRVPSGGKMQIRGVTFGTSKGIVVRQPKTAPTSLQTATLYGFWATEDSGFQIDATNGGDGLINDAKLMVALVRFAGGAAPGNINGSTLVQNIINAKAQKGLREYVVGHRESLLRAGATPKLLRALEETN